MSSITDTIRKISIQAIALVSVALPVAAQDSQSIPVWDRDLLDSCEQTDNTSSIGTAWTASLDHERGGSSSIEWFTTADTFGVTGVIEPVTSSMGPGTAGMFLPLAEDGSEFDVNSWDGIRITVKHSGAPLLLRLQTSEIENGDYFAATLPDSRDFQTFEFPFSQLGQVMSAQQPWSGRTATAIELVTFGWTTQEFSWEIQDLSFYRDQPQDSILRRTEEGK